MGALAETSLVVAIKPASEEAGTPLSSQQTAIDQE
jgi:hypothetical protein